MPATSARMAESRAVEAKEAGAAIVTGCPSCRTQLARAGVETHDLLDLVARSL
jgi:Fe-S oxidoreductase